MAPRNRSALRRRFGAAGIGMLIGQTIYLSGRRWLPPDAPVVVAGVSDLGRVEDSERAVKTPLTHREKMGIVALLETAKSVAQGGSMVPS